MITRRTLLAAAAALPVIAKASAASRFGLEIYSLRGDAEKDLPATLALIRKFGFHELEVGEFYGRTVPEFHKMLQQNELRATSMMAAYERLGSALDAVIADAHTLGVEYVVASTIPHERRISPESMTRAIDDFGKWGEKLSASGLHLCYHTHGVEFDKSAEGTLFDTLVQRTNPKHVNFEMDIFWIVYAFQDPAKLLHKYPGRFPLMHVKDIRKGTKLGGSPADVLEEESVPLGKGIVDIPAALRAAKETGVRHYYIEDEAVNAAEQLPESLKFLESIRV
ncbi:MAG TPA: sugar phosphate isomerase/epimerase [Bryobacteraceae bacterium]|nr:sugar phosphate isomerase/epimerase [Bryobacteraceae bacterium]